MDEALKIAMVPAVASIIVVLIATLWQNGKLHTIHLLVNSQLQQVNTQLQQALERIHVLEGVIRTIQEIKTTHEVRVIQDAAKDDNG